MPLTLARHGDSEARLRVAFRTSVRCRIPAAISRPTLLLCRAGHAASCSKDAFSMPAFYYSSVAHELSRPQSPVDRQFYGRHDRYHLASLV